MADTYRRSVTSANTSGIAKRWRSINESQIFALGVMTVVLLALWQGAVTLFGVPTYLLPEPRAVAKAFGEYPGLLFAETLATFREVIAGFLIAVFTAIPIAILMEYSKVLERYMYPLIVISQAVPKVAVAPLFLVWFGFGEFPKMLIAALIAFFPMVVSATVGFRAIDPEMLSLAKSMGGSAFKTFWKIRFPSALPNLFGGLKLAVTFAVIGAVVGEFVGGDHGLGYLVQVSSGTQRLDLLFAALIVLSVMSVGLYYAVEFCERRLVPWERQGNLVNSL